MTLAVGGTLNTKHKAEFGDFDMGECIENVCAVLRKTAHAISNRRLTYRCAQPY